MYVHDVNCPLDLGGTGTNIALNHLHKRGVPFPPIYIYLYVSVLARLSSVQSTMWLCKIELFDLSEPIKAEIIFKLIYLQLVYCIYFKQISKCSWFMPST